VVNNVRLSQKTWDGGPCEKAGDTGMRVSGLLGSNVPVREAWGEWGLREGGKGKEKGGSVNGGGGSK